MMKRFVAVMCIWMGAAALSACGSNSSNSNAVTVYGTPALTVSNAPAASLTQLGGSLQGTALAAFTNVSTVAGITGVPGSANLVKTGASFFQPNGITADVNGNLFIADYKNHTIRQMVLATGEVKLLAGVAGAAGSVDSAAGIATFNFPNAITTDGTNLYVTDASFTVRKIVISTQVVSTLAGLAGNVGSVDATGTSARFNQLNGITTDGNNLYVTDSNNTIRWIDKVSGVVKTLAGSVSALGTTDGALGAARFNRPARITCDGPNLYVCDFNNRTVRKVVIASGVVSTLAGTAASLSSVFNQPNGITTDGTNLFVTDSFNNTIHKILIASGTVTTIAGSTAVAGTTDGLIAGALFHTPIGITTDGRSLYLTDSENHTLRRIY